MPLNLDSATKFATLQRRLRAAAIQEPDPISGNTQSASATAGMIREAANLAEQSQYTGDAVRLNQIAGGVFAENLAGNAWFSLAKHAAGIISAILIKSGFRSVDLGWMDLNVAGPSVWEIQRKYYGAAHQPTNEPVTKLPPPPAPAPVAVPSPPAPPSVEGVAQPKPNQTVQAKAQVVDMADPLTGVEDPLADPVFSTSTGRDLGDIRASGFDWRDALAGAAGGYAQGGLGGAVTGGLTGAGVSIPGYTPGQTVPGGFIPTATPGIAAGDAPVPPQGWYDYLKNLILPGGNGGDGGGMVPGVFDIGDIYQMLPTGGNGQMPDVGSLMLPAVTAPSATQRLKAPKGYVIVTIQRNDPLFATAINAGGVQQADGSVKVAMDKDKAKKRKYWRPRPKPWLTASDKRVLTKANRVEKKVAKAYLKAGIGPKDIKEAKNC